MNINELLYSEESSVRFDFDKMSSYPIEYYLSQYDIQSLNNIATSVRWASNISKKYKAMDDIMFKRGFRKFGCGTNRRIYRHLEDDSILFKVGYDKVGVEDNPKEFINQQFLKPYVCKMFHTTPCGTIGCVERIIPLKHRYEFEVASSDIFDLLWKKILGVYVLDDIGSKSFMNYGIRKGFGPCLLDYPYLYEVDMDDLICKKEIDGHMCGGLIDYDIGFNRLICNRCGEVYSASSIGHSPYDKLSKEKSLIIEDTQDSNFRVKVIDKDGNIIVDNSHRESSIIK